MTTFLWLLALFVFVFVPLSNFDRRLAILIDISFATVLISGIWATISSAKLARLAAVFVLIALISSLVQAFYNENLTIKIVSTACDIPALGLFLTVVFRLTLRDGPINVHRIKGGIACYLLLAVIWAKLYQVIWLYNPESFNGLQQGNPLISLLYFSFVSLTTVGYGDIIPVAPFARSLANVEALIGQLFPAVFIARLVGLELEGRKRA